MDLSDVYALRIAAFAYYRNASQDLQQRAHDFFNAMDVNSDKQVSLDEYVTFFRACGYNWIDRNMFRVLDLDRDGRLDFYDVLALYYFMKTRVGCQVCRVWLSRMYFTCLACFDSGGNHYDLCSGCYAHDEIRFQHCHPYSFIAMSCYGARRCQMPAAHPPNMSLVKLMQQHQMMQLQVLSYVLI
ncbi:hypothetical protein I3843_02G090900 [Carya illinoinensis]|nr:hypothetical protein I3843_02G090900 [Carya illinoinensis]